MADVTAYPVGVRLLDLPREGEAAAVAPDVVLEDAEEAEQAEDGVDEAAGDGSKVWSKKTQVFKKNNKLGKRRTVAFKHAKDFSATVYYTTAKLLQAGTATPDIVLYNITGVEAALAEKDNLAILEEVPQEPKVEVAFSLSSSGTIGLTRAELTLRKLIKVEVVKPKVYNATAANSTTEKDEKNATDADGETEKETEEEDDTKEEEVKEETADEVKDEAKEEAKAQEGEANEGGNSTDNSTEAKVEEEVKEYKYHNKTVRIPLKIVTSYPEALPLPMTKVLLLIDQKHTGISRAC
jgi:hypothetical protein